MKSITYPSITALFLFLLLTGTVSALVAADTVIEAEAETRSETQAGREAAIEARAEAQTNRVEIKAEARASSSKAKEDRQEQMAEQRAALSERSKERITNLAANISNRMDMAADRIQNIITRLESRIDKLAAAGLDTNEASARLAGAQVAVTAAQTGLVNIDTRVQAAVSAENPRAAWVEAKGLYGSIRKDLRTAHTEIKASIQALKDAARTTNKSAATTTNNAGVSAEEPDAAITSEADTSV